MADVGCAGILVADTICGPLERLPRAGELLAVDAMPVKVGGCAANVAIDLAKQGFQVDACGCVGADASADVVVQSLTAAGVDCGQIQRIDSRPTSKTLILLVEGEDRRYLHLFGANAAFQARHVRRDWIDGLKVFYLGGLLAMPGLDTAELADLLRYCRQRGIVTVIDVVVPQDQSEMEGLRPLLPYTDYFLPNDDEARHLTGFADTERQIEALLRCGVGTAIITCGPAGSVAVAADQRQRWQAGTFRVQSIDGSGAGDAFAAGIITGVVRGWDMGRTLQHAAALGAFGDHRHRHDRRRVYRRTSPSFCRFAPLGRPSRRVEGLICDSR